MRTSAPVTPGAVCIDGRRNRTQAGETARLITNRGLSAKEDLTLVPAFFYIVLPPALL